jgi:hypothetical protein
MHECCCMEKIKINKRDMENERNILRLHGFHLQSIISAPYKFGEPNRSGKWFEGHTHHRS